MFREWTPLKKILFIYVASTLAGLLFVDFYLHRALESTALERWRVDQRALTDSISELVEVELSEAFHDLQLIAGMPAFAGLPFVEWIDPALNGIPEHLDQPKKKMLEALRKHFSVLFVLLPNGDHYISHPFSVQRNLLKYNLSDRPYFQKVVKTGQAVVSDSFSGAEGIPVVVMDVPVLDPDGQIVLHLGGVFHLTRLSQLVKKERIGRFGSAFIVDRQGYLIAHTDQNLLSSSTRENFSDHPIVSAFLNSQEENFSQDYELVEFSDPETGDESLGTFVPMSFDWGLVLLRKKDELGREIIPQQREMIILVAAILLAIGSIGAPFVRHIGKHWERTEQEVKKSRDDLEERVNQRTTQLRQSEARIHAIIDNTTSLIYLKNLRGNYLLVNRSFEEQFKLTNGDIIGKNDFDLFPEALARQLQANDRQALKQRKAINFEEQISRNEQIKYYLSVKFPLADESGIYAICGVSTDITERKSAEDELKQLDKMKSEFMATAAHELRTPLTAVLGYSELLSTEERLEPELVRECLGIIRQKAQSLEKLIDQLFDLSKVESGRTLTLEKETFDCAAEVRQLTKEFRWEYPHYRFALQGLDEPLPLFADKDRFRQVMENLLGNAVKFAPEGSLVDVAARSEDGTLEMTVRDQGIGMSADQVGKVFDKFYRVDASSTGKQGLGLGLALIRHIVEAHDGRIWMESEEGQGTKVIFTLPLNRQGPEQLS